MRYATATDNARGLIKHARWLFLALTVSSSGSHLAVEKKEGTLLFFASDETCFAWTDACFTGRQGKDETTRAAPLSAAPDADLLCGPVKHLYQLTRGELTACPVAVGIAKRKLAGPRTRSAIGTLIRSDRYAECSVPRESVPRRSHPRAKVPHLNKPFDILSPSINKTTRWLIITRHSDTLRRSQDSREMRNSPRLSFRITFNYRFLEWTDRDYDREFSSCN